MRNLKVNFDRFLVPPKGRTEEKAEPPTKASVCDPWR